MYKNTYKGANAIGVKLKSSLKSQFGFLGVANFEEAVTHA